MEMAEQFPWRGHKVHAAEAIWKCVRSRAVKTPNTPDGLDYYLDFIALEKRVSTAPDSRKLHLRTNGYLVLTEPWFVTLIVDGQMLETEPWDRFKEVHEKD
jgi:hypothetical protein